MFLPADKRTAALRVNLFPAIVIYTLRGASMAEIVLGTSAKTLSNRWEANQGNRKDEPDCRQGPGYGHLHLEHARLAGS